MTDDPAEGARDDIRPPDAGHDHAAHHHHEGRPHAHRDPAVFRRLFWLCLGLTVPTAVFSAGLQGILGLTGPRFPGSDYIPAVFGIAVFALGGRVVASGAGAELRSRTPGRMTLSSFALLVAFGYALAVTLGLDGRDFWWQLAALVTALLLGHRVEMRVLSRLLPDDAESAHAEPGVRRSRPQHLAERGAATVFPIAVGAAALAALVWLLLRPDDAAFVIERVVAVLVIAGPLVFGLSVPLVIAVSTMVGARRGIRVHDRGAFDTARTIDVVLFDLTGTLTAGEPTLTRVVVATPGDAAEALGLAAAVEARSGHPIGRALVVAAREQRVKTGRGSGFTRLEGRGAAATVAGRQLTVASRRLTIERGIRLAPELVHATREALGEGATIVYLLEESHALAMFVLADPLRPESGEAVAALRRRGARVAMLTGDSHAVAERVARELGIQEVFAEVLPGEKSAVVARLQSEGAHRVAVVADGVDDAEALARGDVGFAVGADAETAIEAAGVVIASADPRGVVDFLTLGRAGHRKALQNLAWATAYHVVGIPLAAGVLAGFGVLLPPVLGALLVSAATIVVALNTRLLERMRFRR